MSHHIKCMVFFICAGLVFTAQTARCDDKEKEKSSEARPAASTHQTQNRPQPQQRQVSPQHQVSQQPQRRQEPPQQPVHREPQPVVQNHSFQPDHQEREAPRVYAVAAPAFVPNNRFLNRQHHKNWQPRYNFYDNQYHFYPYVNIASTVDLTGACYLISYNGQNYYYDQGTFYVQDVNGQYVAVEPPLGIIVNPLAPRARQINVNDQVFYRYKGVFYIQVAQGYQVIAPVQADPEGSS